MEKSISPGTFLTHYLDIYASPWARADGALRRNSSFYTGNNRVVDLDYPVARQYAYTFRRPSGYG